MTLNILPYIGDVARRLRDDEEGLALTEYLILLGLLTAAVVFAVLAFGGALGDQWALWNTFIENLNAPPTL